MKTERGQKADYDYSPSLRMQETIAALKLLKEVRQLKKEVRPATRRTILAPRNHFHEN